MFHNKELQNLHENYEQTIQESKEFIDKISKDIRLLEQLLRNAEIGNLNYEFDNGKYLNFTKGRLEYCDKKTYKPLTECKAGVMIKVARYLPDFFEMCMGKIKSGIKNAGF